MSSSESRLPLAVEIEISSYCNRKCPYCPNSRLSRPEQGDMDEGLFQKVLKQLSELGYRGRISYHFYNEPLASSQLERFVEATRAKLPDSRIEIFTNGTLLGGSRLVRLLNLGVSKFTVTKHVGSDLSAFEEAYRLLEEADRKRVVYRIPEELVFTSRGGLVPGYSSFPASPPLRRPCFVPFSVAVITLKGNVLPCFEDYLQVNIMGNVNDEHFGSIWASERYRSFRERLKRGLRSEHSVCRQCDYALVVS